MRPGVPERQTHDYVRHGTTSLFAALNVATGQVTDACYPKHRHQEFLKFLKKVAAAYRTPACTWSATTTPPASTPRSGPGWPGTRGSPCISPQPAAPGSTWCFFSVITRQAIRRGSFRSVRELTGAIAAFIDHWNQHPAPFA